ncbi:protein deadpan [Toxorhynchites rutilus septentrionalis]|uniref:protein deadpan n=1 Tax=Toxorhynchites rutilus septentrionalis TaxID=329112 RepID=UPI00247883F0|nr:protein deadpan [Toxorhynchites rutilus septentrionalis]
MSNPRDSDHHGGDGRDAENYLRRIKAEIRKTNKPIMEKKRRARINNYLNDLKALLLDAMKKDPMRHSKLEKADILDLTVKYLQDLERRKLSIAMAVDPSVVDKFKSGYNECVDEIDKYLNTVPGVDNGMKQRISNHLKTYLKYQRFPQPGGNPFGGLFSRSTDEINNNGRLAMDGMPLIPSLLPSGELAFIMPHTGGNSLPFLPRFPTGAPGVPSLSSSHFKPISSQEKQQYAPSPPLSPVSDQDSMKDLKDLKTPLVKTRPTLMESLLSVFPTPPTPEESSRISAFRPNHKLIDRIRLHQEDTRSTPQRANEAKRRKVEKEEEFSDSSDSEEDEEENEAKESGSGDMWRPW